VNTVALSLVRVLMANSDDIAKAVTKLPPDARELYAEAAEDLNIELTLLATAESESQQDYHKNNIAHIKSTLASLDAVTDINLYKTTINVLGVILKTAVGIALAL
jgi:hypothetical protein